MAERLLDSDTRMPPIIGGSVLEKHLRETGGRQLHLYAAFLITRTSRRVLREAIDLLTEITRGLGTVIVNGYKVMEKEGRVSAQLVQAFQGYVSKRSRMPFLAETLPEKGEIPKTQRRWERGNETPKS